MADGSAVAPRQARCGLICSKALQQIVHMLDAGVMKMSSKVLEKENKTPFSDQSFKEAVRRNVVPVGLQNNKENANSCGKD